MKAAFYAMAVIGTLVLYTHLPTAVAKPKEAELNRCNVIWTTPGKDAGDSMPLGNGEVGINLWVEAGGDLHFYISRTDSYSEASRLVKVGGIRVSLSPNPFMIGSPFRQELRLRRRSLQNHGWRRRNEGDADGVCRCRRAGGARAGAIRFAAVGQGGDRELANPRHVLPTGDEPIRHGAMQNAPFELVESADVFLDGLDDAVAWYHRNETSVFPVTLKHQGLEAAADKVLIRCCIARSADG